jgi:LCP family protein required for cell wall assembly
MNISSKTRKLWNNPWLFRGMAALAILGVGVLLAIGAFMVARQFTLKGAGGAQAGGPEFTDRSTAAPGEVITNSLGTVIPPTPVVVESLKPWDGVGRVTILLLGLDYRDWSSGEKYWRSDTMILLTLDPLSGQAGILSIPRDMWVDIPGFGHAKINTAYYLGDANKLPGGGPALAVKTVEQFLGVPVNYYAQIDFAAFVRFIDEIGGVKINIPQAITVDLLGAGSATKKTLKPGVQVLPGEWALAYARARYTEGGDFDRANRQQEVILAIRNQILSFNMLPTLITKAPTLYNELASGIHTNLPMDDAVRLAVLALEVPKEKIHQGVIGKGYVLFGTSPDNLSVLIPLPDKISVLRDEIFATSGALSPQTPGDLATQMKIEGAKVALRNASRAGDLAQRTADYLKAQGMAISDISDLGQVRASSALILHTDKPFGLHYLSELLNVPAERITLEYDPNSPVDIEVILGADWAGKNPLP